MPSSSTSAARSATGMNTSGVTLPNTGCSQRASASMPTMCWPPVARLNATSAGHLPLASHHFRWIGLPGRYLSVGHCR
jgi:hypothetical protein